MYYVGIDIAKKSHTVATLNTDITQKTTTKQFSDSQNASSAHKDEGSHHNKNKQKDEVLTFTNDASGFGSLINYFDKMGVSPDNCLVAMEITGHYWCALYSFLSEKKFQIALINPVQTKAFRNAESLRKTKTDIIDASLIANFAYVMHLEPSSLAPEFSESLKKLSRYRAELVKKRTMLKNKATALCDELFPELASVIGGVRSLCARAIMKEFTTPQTIASTDIRTLTKTLKRASQGRFGRAQAQALKDAAKKSVGNKFTLEASAFMLKNIIEFIECHDKQIKEVEAEIARITKGTLVENLTTIPGISDINAAVITAEIGCPDNFENAKKVIAFAGLDPSKTQSGEFDGTKGHMSKRGSSYLRCALMRSADIARMCDPYFGDYYDALRARGKHHFVALSAVARKLAGVVLAVMKEQRNYEKRPPIQPLGKTGKVAI